MRNEAWRIPIRKQPWYQRMTTWGQNVVKRATPDWLSSLGRRLVTAVIALPIALLAIWFGGWVAFAAVTFILAVGIYELHVMFHKIDYSPLTWLSFIFGVVLFIGALDAPLRQTFMEATVSMLVLGSLSWLLLRRSQPGKALMDWALTLVMTLYLAWPLSYLLSLRGMSPAYVSTTDGFVAGPGTSHFWWLLVVCAGVWAFDSAAFFAGRFFGKHLLAPATSPNKTWEGTIGGTLFSLFAVFVLTRPIAIDLAWYHIVILGLLISFAATFGDLAESLIKRQAGVKDSGKFFWGHGGVLDRIDSILFAGVVVYFYLALVLHVL